MKLLKFTGFIPWVFIGSLIGSVFIVPMISKLVDKFFYKNKYNKEGVSKCTHPLFYAQSPDFLKPELCYFLKFLYL